MSASPFIRRIPLSRWAHFPHKRLVVHGAFLLLIVAITLQGRATPGIDRTALLYTLVAGDEVIEGPLDPSAYAQTDAPGIGGARLAAADADLGVDLITFEDAEVEFGNPLGGTAVVAPLSPLAPEPGTRAPSPARRAATVYTIEEGDTVASIAAKFDVSTNTILWANGLTGDTVIKVGDHLTILPTTGVLHTVQSGDTVSAIAEKYDADAAAIIASNGLDEEASLSLKQKLIVPDGYVRPAAPSRIVSSDTAIASRDLTGEAPPGTSVAGEGWVWPSASRHVAQSFRWGHTGIDLDDRARPPVYAAQAGTVEFTGWLGGYGNLLILNHGDGVETYYAHLSGFYVGKGEAVAKGQAIGKMGTTGRSTGPHLHFEVRQNGRPVNPLGKY